VLDRLERPHEREAPDRAEGDAQALVEASGRRLIAQQLARAWARKPRAIWVSVAIIRSYSSGSSSAAIHSFVDAIHSGDLAAGRGRVAELDEAADRLRRPR